MLSLSISISIMLKTKDLILPNMESNDRAHSAVLHQHISCRISEQSIQSD